MEATVNRQLNPREQVKRSETWMLHPFEVDQTLLESVDPRTCVVIGDGDTVDLCTHEPK